MPKLNVALFALLSLTACAPVDESPPDPMGGESSDDLVGRKLNVHPKSPERRLGVGIHSVRPTLEENGKVIDVYTDDIVIAGLPINGVLTIRVQDEGSRTEEYGFLAAYRPAGASEWKPLEAVSGDSSWQWLLLEASQVDGKWSLTGAVQQVKDTSLSTEADSRWERARDREVSLGPAADFRIHVVPLWDHWDWDETGYEAKLVVKENF